MTYPFSRSNFTLQSRITVGRISSVDEQNSIMLCEPADHCGPPEPVSLPFAGLTGQRGKPTSWVRYMPREGDFAVYARDNRGLAFPLGYIPYAMAGDPTATDSDTEGTQGGSFGSDYGQNAWSPGAAGLHALHDSGTVAGFEQFSKLGAGEWDMKSSGGAYIHGSKGGSLTLSGGGATNWILSKKRTEISGSTELMKVAAGNCAFRYGSIKRQGPADLSPVSVSLAPLPDPREWYVKIGNSFPLAPTPGIAPLPADVLYEEKAGDVWSEDLVVPGTAQTTAAGTLQQSSAYQGTYPLRYMRAVHLATSSFTAFQPGALLAHLSTIDAFGNMQITHGPTTSSVIFGPPTGVSLVAIEVEAASMEISCNKNVLIDGTTGIQFGGAATAIEPLVLGLKLQAALTTFASALALQFPIMGTPPGGGLVANGTALGTAAATLNSALGSILSAKVKTE